MSKDQFIVLSSVDQEVTRRPVSITEFFSKCLYYWPWFVLSAIFFGLTTFFLLKRIEPIYEIHSKIIIKDEKSFAKEKSPLEEINVTVIPKTVENEMEILKSRLFLSKTIEDLQLWIAYGETLDWGSRDLFNDAPFHMLMLSGTRDSLENKVYEITIKDSDHYVINGLGKQAVNAVFNDTIKANQVSWKLDTTKYLRKYIGKTIRVNFLNKQKLISHYQKEIQTSLANKLSPIIELTLDDHIPNRGVQILNSLMNTYNQEALNEKNRVTISTLRFIEDRLTSLTGELSLVEKNAAGFKSSRGITDLSSEAKIYLQNVQSNDSRLSDINIQLDVVKGIEKFINSNNDSGNPPATLGISDPGLTSLVNQLSKLQLQRISLSATTPEENPIFDPLNKQIRSTKEAIRENINGIKMALLNTKSQLQSNNSRFESSIKNIPGQERQYTDIKRQQEIKANLYIYLLQKKEEVALRYASEISDAQIIEDAYYNPPKSKKLLILAVAFMLGMCLPAGFIFSRDLIRGNINSKNEIEIVLDIPIISELSYHKEKESLQNDKRPNTLILEQFRTLRTKLTYLHDLSSKSRVTLFTSSVAGEGKSFVINNLSISLAASERKTVIVELDLRRPNIAELFKIDSKHHGVSDFLNGNAAIHQIVQSMVTYPNLSIITCGNIPVQPSELLDNRKLKDLFTWLRDEYDDILIDTPPVHLVSDALILDKYSDVTLYIVRQGFTSKSELTFIKQLNREKNFKNMNIIFNGINRLKNGYGYKYDTSYYR